MAQSIDEFFADDRLTDSNLRSSAERIHGFLEHKVTAQETAQTITGIVSVALLSEILDECIIRAAEHLPETHNDLVELVMQFRSQQQYKSEDGLGKFDDSLVMSLGERWAGYGDPDPQEAWKKEVRVEWANLNHFAALLFSAGIKKLASFGVQTLKMTLKRGSWRVNWTGSDSESSLLV